MAANETRGPGGVPLRAIDRLIHEPARLVIVSTLYVVERADFLFLMRHAEMTQGNLSSHLNKLEAAGYIEVTKGFKGKRPHTMLRLTDSGRAAFDAYRLQMEQALSQTH
jgi:DNA-binding MarR family transcriptional regulator